MNKYIIKANGKAYMTIRQVADALGVSYNKVRETLHHSHLLTLGEDMVILPREYLPKNGKYSNGVNEANLAIGNEDIYGVAVKGFFKLSRILCQMSYAQANAIFANEFSPNAYANKVVINTIDSNFADKALNAVINKVFHVTNKIAKKIKKGFAYKSFVKGPVNLVFKLKTKFKNKLDPNYLIPNVNILTQVYRNHKNFGLGNHILYQLN